MTALVAFIVAFMNSGSIEAALAAITEAQWIELAGAIAVELAKSPIAKEGLAGIAPAFHDLVQGVESGKIPQDVGKAVFAAILTRNGDAAIRVQDELDD